MPGEFLIARHDGGGRGLLGLGNAERAGRMLAAAGMTVAKAPGGDSSLVLYPAEAVGPAGVGLEVAAAIPPPDGVLALTVPDGRPILVAGALARASLLGAEANPDRAWDLARGSVSEERPLASPAVAVVDDRSRRAARRLLLRSLRKPVDGVVSRTLNRPVSLAISSVLVWTPLTPNVLTVLTFLTAVAASALMASTHFMAGAVVMQFASILDGCDGEVARLRYRSSKLGSWLDTVFDDVSNIVFLVATGYGLRVAYGEGWGTVFLWMGVATGVFALIVLVQTYRRLLSGRVRDSGSLEWSADPDSDPFRRFLAKYLIHFVKRDTFYLCFLVAALAGLPWLIVVWSVVGGGLAALTTLGRQR